jgi:hypothetical protein
MFARTRDRQLEDGSRGRAGANDVRPDSRLISLRLQSLRLQPGIGVAAISKTDCRSQSPTIRGGTSTQSRDPKMHLREGAIYSDHSNNIIQLLSINSDYCAYAYLALGSQRADMHGSVTGLTRRNVFESGFIFVAECVDEWKRNQRDVSNRLQGSPVPTSLDSIDFTPARLKKGGRDTTSWNAERLKT